MVHDELCCAHIPYDEQLVGDGSMSKHKRRNETFSRESVMPLPYLYNADGGCGQVEDLAYDRNEPHIAARIRAARGFRIEMLSVMSSFFFLWDTGCRGRCCVASVAMTMEELLRCCGPLAVRDGNT